MINNMKEIKKGSPLLGLLTGLMLCLAAVLPAGPVYAQNAGADIKRDVFSFERGQTLDALKEEARSYPESFDLRRVDTNKDGTADSCFVTPVKLQNPFGTCWGFAAISAAESSILSDRELNRDKDGNPIYSISLDQHYNAKNQDSDGRPFLDLSEKHLAYFITSHIDDPDDPQNGEGVYFKNVSKKDKQTSTYRFRGSWVSLVANMFASGLGPNLEDRTDPETGESLKSILAYQGRNGEISYQRAAVHHDDQGAATQYARVPAWYSKDDDWSIPDKYRSYRSFRLKDTFALPSPAGLDSNSKYKYVPEATAAIKQQLSVYHRAVSVSFTAESYLPGQDTSGKKFMSNKWAHYTYGDEMSNHAVTIIGYDDNYPKENFLEGHQPPQNGAWFVKNSWGSELNEFPNNGYRHWGLLEGMDKVPYDSMATAVSDKATGYFWISYYDESLFDPEAFDFDLAAEENDYYIGQMDTLQGVGLGVNSMKGSKMANVFETQATAQLRAISILTATPGSSAHYEIYLLPDDYTGPEDGVKIAEGDSGKFDYGGFHRIELDAGSRKILAKGQKYSVIVRQSSESGDYISCAVSNETDDSYSKTVVNKGESFLYCQGKWLDLSLRANQQKAYPSLLTNSLDNFPIKTYLEPVTYQEEDKNIAFEGYLSVDSWHDGSLGSYSIQINESKTMTSEFRGIRNLMPAGWDPDIRWKIEDDSIARLEVDKSNQANAVIYGVKEGRTFLTVEAEGYGTRLVSVISKKPAILYFTLAKDTYTYTGKAIRPKVSGVDSDSVDLEKVLVEGVDYKVTYKNNINAGKGIVTVTGIGEISGTESEEFLIKKAANPMAIKGGKTAKVKYVKLKKKPLRLAVTRLITFKKNIKDQKNYTLLAAKKGKKSFKKSFKINKKTGKLLVRKGLKKGIYKIKIKVKALGNNNYKASGWKTVTFKVRVR